MADSLRNTDVKSACVSMVKEECCILQVVESFCVYLIYLHSALISNNPYPSHVPVHKIQGYITQYIQFTMTKLFRNRLMKLENQFSFVYSQYLLFFIIIMCIVTTYSLHLIIVWFINVQSRASFLFESFG